MKTKIIFLITTILILPFVMIGQQFMPIWSSPYNPMTFYFTGALTNGENLQAGDEVGIFDLDAYGGGEICVGAGVLVEVLTGGVYLEVIASMDDGSFPDQSNGFAPGNDFIFKLYSQTLGQVEDVIYTFPYPGYDETFASQGSALVGLEGAVQSNQYFQPVWISPYNPMTIYAVGALLEGSNLQPGDEIGIFDIDPNTGQEICVGFGTLVEELGGDAYLEMIASMDDGALPDQANGFTPGNDLIFKYYSQISGLVENIEISFPYPGYDEAFASQGSAFVELNGSLNPSITFDPVWTSPYNPMTFYITQALLDGVDMNVPAQIGIFDVDPNTGQEICVGEASLTGILSPENYLEIIASMDDGSLPDEANGFTPGHDFIFKYISAGVLVEQVSYSFPYAGYDVVFTSQGNAIVDLSGTSAQGEQHTISLSTGWMGISSYLEPANVNMADVVGGISGQLEMINNLEAFYQPGNVASTLNSWSSQSGYFIKVSEGVDLIIQGNAPGTTTINLSAGWNLIPVLSAQATDIETLFAGNLNKVEIIKEAVGMQVYWPVKSIATFEELLPGAAYMVKATESFSITY